MTRAVIDKFDEKLDLVLERVVAAPRNKLWQALVDPELVKQWFCPKPWQTVDCRIDLRPGGEFYTVMQSPEGQKFPGTSCILEVIPNERLVWTAALRTGYRPAAPATEADKQCAEIVFTCVITLEDAAGGTKYSAFVMHGSEQQSKSHADMGFHDGWGVCLTQLVDVANGL